MSVYATYEVCVDLDNDRAYGSANENISAYVKEMEWQIGATEPFADIARANTARLVLNNKDGRFSPERLGGLSGFSPGALIRIRSTFAATTRQHFVGWIDPNGIQVEPGPHGKRETVVTASGFFSRLFDDPVRVPLQEGKRTDEIIEAILGRTSIYPPGMIGWLLGLPGFSELGEATYLGGGTSDYASLDAGIETFNYVGDTWNERTSIYSALRELIMAERGFLFEGRDGKLVFYNRHHWHTDMANPVDATLTGSDIDRRLGMDYRYGNVLNRRTIRFHPRSVDGSTSVIARANTNLIVKAGSTATTRLRYDDGSGNRIGAKDVITPLATTDWTANAAEDGTGTNLTGSISISATIDANGIELIFTNGASQDAFIRGLQVRGTKITDFGDMQVTVQDDQSIGDYGLQAEALSLALLDEPSVALDLATWDVLTRKEPTGIVRGIGVYANGSTARMTYALARQIGDRIALTETQTGYDTQSFIVGERHTVNSRYQHNVTHIVRPAPPSTVWILGVAGYSELGETTYLGA